MTGTEYRLRILLFYRDNVREGRHYLEVNVSLPRLTLVQTLITSLSKESPVRETTG